MTEEYIPKTKKVLKWIVSIVIALWIYFTYHQIHENIVTKRIVKQTQELLDLKTEEAVRYKDRYNVEHLRAEKLYVDKLVFAHHNKELARQLKLKPKQIEGKTMIVTELEFVHHFDTLYRDNYIEIEKKGDSIYLSASDTLILTEYWKRKWFLGQKHYYADISNKNPHIKLMGLSSIEMKKKNPTVIIGPYVGWDAFTRRPSAGISLIFYPLALKL